MDDDLLHEGKWLTFRALETTTGEHQAKKFLLDLPGRDWSDFLQAAEILDISFEARRGPSGRAERIKGSRVGLCELKVTPPGRRGRQIRILYVRAGSTIWCARGVIKRERLSRRDIDLAEETVRKWRAKRPRRKDDPSRP